MPWSSNFGWEEIQCQSLFTTQIGHRPRASNSKRGPNEDLKKKQGLIMTILGRQYDADAKKRYLQPTRNSLCIFFPSNDVVSYREFISNPLHLRLEQLCPTPAQSKVLCGPFQVLAAVISILHIDNHFLFCWSSICHFWCRKSSVPL